MTNPIQPATDEDVERIRCFSPTPVESRLIARIDAERAALTESEAVRDRMRALLDAVAVAVRGPPAPNVLHDHARLPDEVAEMRAERDAERAARERAEAERDAERSAVVLWLRVGFTTASTTPDIVLGEAADSIERAKHRCVSGGNGGV